MTKKSKKKNIVADELIDSLMEDIKKSSPAEESYHADPESVTQTKNSEAETSSYEAVGLLPEENMSEATAHIWQDVKTGSQSIDVFESTAAKEFLNAPEAGVYNPIDEIMGQLGKSPDVPVSSDYYQPEGDDDATRPVGSAEAERTASFASSNDPDRTQTAEGFENLRPMRRQNAEEKVSVGIIKPGKVSSVLTSVDASLAQAENLKIAQNRILELEKELDKLRFENEELASAADIIKTRGEEYLAKISNLEREKAEIVDAHQSEIIILKGNLQYKETEVAKSRVKIEELETRLKNDFKKIRVRERELENRLELAKAEKSALVRSKDEYILELKRKIDQLQGELDNYRSKVIELNKTLENNQEQFKRTVRALRLALSNLESKDENIVPLKKAE
ncbi:MAG: hypothetical protein ACLGGX_07955 [Bdellovibrionia bacterium]